MADKLGLLAQASELIYREGLYLDQQRWEAWLGLFTEECEYWAPSWVSEHEQITDPQAEISLLYLKGRYRLEERIERAISGTSPASVPLPRTCHFVSNLLLLDSSTDEQLQVHSAWRVDYFHRKRAGAFFGHYRHTLVRRDSGWMIGAKRITVMNDFIPTVMDVYHI